MINNGVKIKVIWNDIKVFSPKNKRVTISKMETIGFVEQDHEDYLTIKDPQTINILTGKKHPEKDPTFYFIPKSLIVETKECE